MLSESRKRIDDIDRAIVALYEERLAIVEEIGAIKAVNQLAVYDSVREAELLKKVDNHIKNPKNAQCVADLFTNIMAASKERQELVMNQKA